MDVVDVAVVAVVAADVVVSRRSSSRPPRSSSWPVSSSPSRSPSCRTPRRSPPGRALHCRPDAPTWNDGGDGAHRLRRVRVVPRERLRVRLDADGPPSVRRTEVPVDGARTVSALVWGAGSPQIVFLHGGAQNAHTWDTVILALGPQLSAVADRSAWPRALRRGARTAATPRRTWPTTSPSSSPSSPRTHSSWSACRWAG